MTTTIPRAEIQAIAEHYGYSFDLDEDPPVDYVRHVAVQNREAVKAWGDVPYRGSLLAEADDLDALADRYEREAGAS